MSSILLAGSRDDAVVISGKRGLIRHFERSTGQSVKDGMEPLVREFLRVHLFTVMNVDDWALDGAVEGKVFSIVPRCEPALVGRIVFCHV